MSDLSAKMYANYEQVLEKEYTIGMVGNKVKEKPWKIK